VVGSVPAVLVGVLLSSRPPDKFIRPAITFVIFASGLKYVGVGTYALGWTMGAVLLAGTVYWLVWERTRPWRREPSSAGRDGGGRAGQLSEPSAYFCTREPTLGSAASMCLAALPRIAP